MELPTHSGGYGKAMSKPTEGKFIKLKPETPLAKVLAYGGTMELDFDQSIDSVARYKEGDYAGDEDQRVLENLQCAQ